MRKRAIGLLCVFLAFMVLFTVLSRAADSITIPRVRVQEPEMKKITHPVSGSGKVAANREQAVSAKAGQTVKEICVEEGTAIKKGDVLFKIDLDDLKEQILLAKQELEKLKLQQKDTNSGKAAEDQKLQTAKNRAAEDYQIARQNEAQIVSNALKAMEESKKQLDFARKGSGKLSGDKSVQKTLEKTLEEQNKAYEKSVSDRKTLEESIAQEIQNMIQEARNQKAARESQPDAKQTQAGTEQTEVQGKADKELSEAEKKNIEAQVTSRCKEALKEAQEKEKKAHKSAEEAKQALENYKADQAAQASSANAADIAGLELACEESKAFYEEALRQQESSLEAAARSIEDAQAPQGSNSTSQVNKLDMEQKKRELNKLQELMEKNGEIKSPAAAVVTKISLAVGEKTMDGAAMLLADLSAGIHLQAQVPADMGKYIARGDEVAVTPSGAKEQLTGLQVETVREQEDEMSGSFLEVTVKLPNEAMEIGTAAAFKVVRDVELSPACIPVNALYQGENDKYFVFVIQEKESILGTVLEAQRMDVTILDKNSSYAALAEEGLGSRQIIVDTDRYLEAGSRVRLEDDA